MIFLERNLVFDKGTSNLISFRMPVANNNIEFEGFFTNNLNNSYDNFGFSLAKYILRESEKTFL